MDHILCKLTVPCTKRESVSVMRPEPSRHQAQPEASESISIQPCRQYLIDVPCAFALRVCDRLPFCELCHGFVSSRGFPISEILRCIKTSCILRMSMQQFLFSKENDQYATITRLICLQHVCKTCCPCSGCYRHDRWFNHKSSAEK